MGARQHGRPDQGGDAPWGSDWPPPPGAGAARAPTCSAPLVATPCRSKSCHHGPKVLVHAVVIFHGWRREGAVSASRAFRIRVASLDDECRGERGRRPSKRGHGVGF